MDDGAAARDAFAPVPWLREHGSAIAFLLLAVVVTAALLLAPRGVRRDGPPPAPPRAAPASEDCPGGVCHTPPAKSKR